MSMELSFAVSGRIGELDLGAVGLARFGNETIVSQPEANVGRQLNALLLTIALALRPVR